MAGAICSDTQSEQASAMIWAAHPFTLDQLGPQWGGGGILQLRQSLLSSRLALALFPYSQAGEAVRRWLQPCPTPKWPVLA